MSHLDLSRKHGVEFIPSGQYELPKEIVYKNGEIIGFIEKEMKHTGNYYFYKNNTKELKKGKSDSFEESVQKLLNNN